MTHDISIGILRDWDIEMLAYEGMISPFADRQVREDEGKHIISYGLSSMGYDIQLGPHFKLFTPGPDLVVIDPKEPDQRVFQEYEGTSCIIPPNSYALGVSIQKFDLPADVLGLVIGKSSYARSGIIVNCTPMEPGWRGYLTIEIANGTPLPVRVHAYEGIAQVLFFRSALPALVSYADRNGKYQDQGPEPEPARL